MEREHGASLPLVKYLAARVEIGGFCERKDHERFFLLNMRHSTVEVFRRVHCTHELQPGGGVRIMFEGRVYVYDSSMTEDQWNLWAAGHADQLTFRETISEPPPSVEVPDYPPLAPITIGTSEVIARLEKCLTLDDPTLEDSYK